MKKIWAIFFLCFATIAAGVVGYNIGANFSVFMNGYRQKACFADFQRFLLGEQGFFEKIDNELYVNDNPQIIEDARLAFLEKYPCYRPYLDNPGIKIADLLPDDCAVFQTGSYLYFPYDNNGKRIKWDNENRRHIVLLDSRPLPDGRILVLYVGPGGSCSEL